MWKHLIKIWDEKISLIQINCSYWITLFLTLRDCKTQICIKQWEEKKQLPAVSNFVNNTNFIDQIRSDQDNSEDADIKYSNKTLNI